MNRTGNPAIKSVLLFMAGLLLGIAGVFLFAPHKWWAPTEQAVARRAHPAPPVIAVVPGKSVTSNQSHTSAEILAAESLANEPLFRTQLGALKIPIAGVSPNQLSDSFHELRGKHPHEAIDIVAPRGTPVVAVDDGKVVKLFNSKPGGLTVYQFDAGERYAYYYAHLDRYAAGLAEGQYLKRGDLVGYVGSTGNANPAAPHLHFAVFELGPEKRWWLGTAINPYPLLGGR